MAGALLPKLILIQLPNAHFRCQFLRKTVRNFVSSKVSLKNFANNLYTSSAGYNLTWSKWADNLSHCENCLIDTVNMKLLYGWLTAFSGKFLSDIRIGQASCSIELAEVVVVNPVRTAYWTRIGMISIVRTLVWAYTAGGFTVGGWCTLGSKAALLVSTWIDLFWNKS